MAWTAPARLHPRRQTRFPGSHSKGVRKPQILWRWRHIDGVSPAWVVEVNRRDDRRMTMTATASSAVVKVSSLADLERERFKVVSAGGHTILVVADGGKVYALDNRCPHMGFPLHRGTVRDGILTCHWHHAKFDLAGGCTL